MEAWEDPVIADFTRALPWAQDTMLGADTATCNFYFVHCYPTGAPHWRPG